MKFIYHHLGLGDHIICNGLVRTLITNNNEYTMFVKKNNLPSVKFMYKDLPNLKFIDGDDSFVLNYLNLNKINENDLIKIGFYKHPNSKEFDDSFYLQHNIPFFYRWEKFYVERDLQSELNLFKKFGIEENNYIFIHDDSTRALNIDEKYIKNKDLPIIRPKLGLTDNIFDYMYLIENSLECHFMDSSFRLMFDSLGSQKKDLFYHINYNGVYRDSTKSQSKLKYTII
jgi:hypothetical protein